MDPIVRTYDSKAIAMSFTTPIQNVIISGSGLPDGDFLAITAPDSFEGEDGADGTHDRVNLNNNTLDIEISVKKTSFVNDLLSAIHAADKATNQGKGTLNIVDTNGTMKVSSFQAYITKYADQTLGKGIPVTTWSFKAPNAVYHLGQNL
jgi:hypothetical protein